MLEPLAAQAGDLLSVERVSRTYLVAGRPLRAVREVSVSLAPGRMVLLRGRSGSGKTTLLNIMGGLESPTEGRVLYRGRDIGSFTQREMTRWRRREIGLVLQSFALLPELSARENVGLPLRIAGMSPAEVAERVPRYLEMVGLSRRAHHRVSELSGGEQQRVALARALVKRPPLLLADEPTGELDQGTAARVLVLLRSIVEREGTSICVTSHDPAVREYVDSSYLLTDGTISTDERSP